MSITQNHMVMTAIVEATISKTAGFKLTGLKLVEILQPFFLHSIHSVNFPKVGSLQYPSLKHILKILVAEKVPINQVFQSMVWDWGNISKMCGINSLNLTVLELCTHFSQT